MSTSMTMLSKFILFTLLAILATRSHGLLTDEKNNSAIVLHTDDTEKLINMNISPILHHFNSIDTRNISYDGTGLKLAGIRFYHKPQNISTNVTQSDIDMVHDTSEQWVHARCHVSACNKQPPVQYASAFQASLVGGGTVCTFLMNKLDLNDLNSGFGFYFKNARCAGNAPCSIVGGAIVLETAADEDRRNALLAKCQTAMARIGVVCSDSGGWDSCRIVHGNGETASGKIAYYAQPLPRGEICKMWFSHTLCGKVECNSNWELCTGL